MLLSIQTVSDSLCALKIPLILKCLEIVGITCKRETNDTKRIIQIHSCEQSGNNMAKHENRSYKPGDNLEGHIKEYKNDRYLSMVSAVVAISCHWVIYIIYIIYTWFSGKARIKKLRHLRQNTYRFCLKDVVRFWIFCQISTLRVFPLWYRVNYFAPHRPLFFFNTMAHTCKRSLPKFDQI